MFVVVGGVVPRSITNGFRSLSFARERDMRIVLDSTHLSLRPSSRERASTDLLLVYSPTKRSLIMGSEREREREPS